VEQFLYKLTPTRPDMLSKGLTDRESEIIGIHFDYLSGLFDKGVVKLAGRTTNTDASSFGVMIFEAENVLAAQLFPFRIALM